MARGTNVSNVNFSIPEGADPMGIGIPDLGKSSYDPIATIKRGWEKDREDRAIKNAERREEWKEQKKAIPTFESVNAKIAGILNQKAVKLGSYVDQQYKAGMFAPWAKSGEVDKDGKRTSTWQEMQRLESELASEGEAYNRLLPAYQKAEAIINDPTKNKQVDWDITKKRMDQFKNGSLEEMADVAPKLVAFKPDQINLQKEFMSILGDYITPDSEPVITKAFDPSTGKLLVRESTSKDQAILLRNTTSAIKDMLGRDDEYSNAMKNQYDMVKPKTKDGVPIDIVTYWVGEKIPDYGEKVKNTWVAPAGEGT
ncbi:hypothetical protein KKC59_04930, partial [bacterium]|nr:hypothetical protein [bacterium]